MLLASRHHVDFAIPGLENGDCESGGASETEQTDSITGLDSGHSQTSETDNSSTEERRDVHWIEPLWQGVGEVFAHKGKLCVPAIDGVSGECRMIAKIFHLMFAEPAIAIDATHPGDTDALSDG